MKLLRTAMALWPALLGALTGSGARAEVKSATDRAFALESTVEAKVDPASVYRSLTRIGRWWSPEHTFSGDAANLSLDARPGGCFCERLPGGGVRHALVIYAAPGKVLRLEGGFGPLQAMPVAAVLTFALEDLKPGTRIHMSYRVSGDLPTDAAGFARTVDSVLTQQLGRLGRFADTGRP